MGSSSQLLTWTINIEKNIIDYEKYRPAFGRVKEQLEKTLCRYSQLNRQFWGFKRFYTKVEWEKSDSQEFQELTLKSKKFPFQILQHLKILLGVKGNNQSSRSYQHDWIFRWQEN